MFFRWQARKEGDRDMRAGLIPSRALQERRILHERAQEEKNSKEGMSLFYTLKNLTVHFSLLCVM